MDVVLTGLELQFALYPLQVPAYPAAAGGGGRGRGPSAPLLRDPVHHETDLPHHLRETSARREGCTL